MPFDLIHSERVYQGRAFAIRRDQVRLPTAVAPSWTSSTWLGHYHPWMSGERHLIRHRHVAGDDAGAPADLTRRDLVIGAARGPRRDRLDAA
jgi:hypothetical protein